MSNPLAYFRRHQKVLLAVFGVLIIIIFTVGGIFTDYQQRQMGPGPASDTVVTWRHGKISEDELAHMRASHNLAIRFLDLLVQRTIEAKGTPKGPGVTRDQRGQIVNPGIPRSFQEEHLVQTRLLARKAEEAGVMVTDQAIYEFLDELSDDVIPRSQFASNLQDATGGRVTREQLFEQLRTELLAQNMRMMAASGLLAMPPGYAWDYFNRLKRQIKAEVLPIEVAEYKDKVTGTPTNAEVEELYDEAKDRYPSPNSPEPGFKRRRKIAFQYLKAEFQRFLDKEMATVTEEQVKKYYEENKDDFKMPELPPAEGEDSGEEAAAAKPSGEEPEPIPGKKDTEPEAKDDAEESQDATATKPESDEPAASEASMEESSETAGPEESTSEETVEPNTPKADKKTKPAGDNPVEPSDSEGASNLRFEDTVFVSLNADEEAGDAEVETKAKSDTKEPADDAVGEKKKEPKPEEAPAADGDEAPKAASDKPDAVPSKDIVAVAVEVKYKPLKDVEDEIRRSIVSKTAQDKLNDALEGARQDIDVHFRKMMRWKGLKEVDSEAEKPASIDPDALAEKCGFAAGETPLVDEIEIGDYELGKAYTFNFSQRQMQTITFAQNAYAEGIPLYKADQIRSFEADVEFLYWKVEEQEPFVPELADHEWMDWPLDKLGLEDKLIEKLDRAGYNTAGTLYKFVVIAGGADGIEDITIEDAKTIAAKFTNLFKHHPGWRPALDEVVDAWKQGKAFQLAKVEAEKLAKKIKGAESMRESLDEETAGKVVDTNEFSWMTGGSVPMGYGQPTLSTVDGVEFAGMDFMEAVFALEPGETGVAVNEPQTFVYVVRVVSETPDEDERRENFLTSGVSFQTFHMAAMERDRVMEQWYRDLDEEMDVKWHRPAQLIRSY